LVTLPTVALILVVAVKWRFGGLYGQDAYAYYDYGTQTLPHFFLHGTPLTALFWPLGYPALIAVSTLLLGPSPAAAQAVSLVAGVGAVILTYLLARDLLVQSGVKADLALRSAATAAMLFGVTGWVVRSSVSIMSDSVAVATSLLAIWAIVRWSDTSGFEQVLARPWESGLRRWGKARSRGLLTSGSLWMVLAAVAMSWSIVTRWGQMAMIPVVVLAAIPTVIDDRRRFLRGAIWAVPVAGILIGTQVFLMNTVKPGLDLGPVPFGGDLSLVNGGSWALGHVFQRVFVNADGVQRYSLANGVFYATAAFRAGYLTPIFAPLVLLGAAVAVVRYRRAAMILISWPLILLLLDAGLPEQSTRFVLAALPPLAVLAGLGSMTVVERLSNGWRAMTMAGLAVCVIAVGVLGMRNIEMLTAANASDLRVAAWAGRQMPTSTEAIAFGITLTLAHTSHPRTIDLSVLSPEQLRAITHRRTYVLVQPWAMSGQWAHLPTGANFRYLRQHIGLVSLGSRNGYTLYRAGTR
jgi:4-amino-4-deoxy-L-arabinose transferase-like glycosyltransferase